MMGLERIPDETGIYVGESEVVRNDTPPVDGPICLKAFPGRVSDPGEAPGPERQGTPPVYGPIGLSLESFGPRRHANGEGGFQNL